MPNLEIITIGTELLLGEITDTNSTYIARTLRDHGIDIFRITTIGDNPDRITSAIKEALARAEIIITTGGLGPTVDDPTRQAVADAIDRKLVFQPKLWKQIIERFKEYGSAPTENNRQQAYIPQDAIPIANPVGTAPCYIIDIDHACVVSLPGVPQEMKIILHESIIPFLHNRFELHSQTIKATVLHAASIGESAVDEIIKDLEQKANPSVGLLAYPGQVDIRITSKANSESEAYALNKPVVEELKSRLGNNIYGQDEDTLENIICQLLIRNNCKLCLTEYGFEGSLIERINRGQPLKIHSQILQEEPKDLKDFSKIMTSFCKKHPCEIGFGAALVNNTKVTVYFVYQDLNITTIKTRKYVGPQAYAQLWAQNTGLDFLRRELNNKVRKQQEKQENHETS